MVLRRVSLSEIDSWTSRVPHWSKIDPYSDLEDMGEPCPSSHEKTSASDPCDTTDTENTPRVLRPCRRHYLSERLRRDSTKDLFYWDMCGEPSEKAGSKGDKSLLSPSEDRQNARTYNLWERKPLNTYLSCDPRKVETRNGGFWWQ